MGLRDASASKKESNSKFDKPAGRDAHLLGLRSSPEEIDVKLKYIIVEEMTFDQELCLKSVCYESLQ